MDYPKEQLHKLYRNLPKDLQKAVFSEKVADIIYNACVKNNVKDNQKIKEVAKHIGFVLMGIIPPDEFPEILEKEIKLEKFTAHKISREINISVFSSVKQSLEALYDTKIKTPKKTITIKKATKDKYRESIE